MPIASDDENASDSKRFSLCFSSPALISLVHITPEELITLTDEISYSSGFSSSTSSIGLAKASPTMVT